MLWRQTMLSQSILYSSSHKTLSMTHIDLFTHINVEGDFSDVSRGGKQWYELLFNQNYN